MNKTSVLQTIKDVRPRISLPLPTTHAINGKLLEKIISVRGTTKDGMFKIVIGRKIQAGCDCM